MQKERHYQQDIRDTIFASISTKLYTACILTERAGVIAGTAHVDAKLKELGVKTEIRATDGEKVGAGAVVAELTGTPKALAMAEEIAIGMLAKPSGIATAARRAVELAGPDLKIVSGAWKKMPPEIKGLVREAVVAGKASFRIADLPFLYLDKNFVRMLGGIAETMTAVASIPDTLKIIQIKGEYDDIAGEAITAAHHGAGILMVDTGNLDDFAMVHSALTTARLRSKVKLAFAKGIKVEDIPLLQGRGMDILDIGMSIIDAPLLDMKLDVTGVSGSCN